MAVIFANEICTIYSKSREKNSSEEKMTLIKVAANDPSYCSKFSFHGRNLKNEDVRAKKPKFLPFFELDHLQQLLLMSFYPPMKFFPDFYCT